MANGDNFRVGGGILVDFTAIAGLGDDLVLAGVGGVAVDDGTDGNLINGCGMLGQFDGA